MEKTKRPVGRPPVPERLRRRNKVTLGYTDAEWAKVKRAAVAHKHETPKEWLFAHSIAVANAVTGGAR